MGAGWRRWRLSWFDRLAVLVVVRRFHGMGVAVSRSLRCDNYVHIQHFVRRTTSIPFWRFWEDVRREFMQCLYYVALHGTLGSYLRDAFQKGGADALARLLVPRAQFLFLVFFFSAWWPPLLFFVRKVLIIRKIIIIIIYVDVVDEACWLPEA
jgi:hypothetical protein